MSVEQWGKTRVDMKKFGKPSYQQAVALSYQGYEPMTTYLHWIMQTYGGKIGATQAYDLGKFLLRIRFTAPAAKKSGFRRVIVSMDGVILHLRMSALVTSWFSGM